MSERVNSSRKVKVSRPGRRAGGEVRTMSASQLRASLAEVVNGAAYGHERVVLTRRGRPIVAVVPIEDLALIQDVEERNDAQDFRAAVRAARRKPTVRWNDLKKELGL
jgi:prevent-host-death family protein